MTENSIKLLINKKFNNFKDLVALDFHVSTMLLWHNNSILNHRLCFNNISEYENYMEDANKDARSPLNTPSKLLIKGNYIELCNNIKWCFLLPIKIIHAPFIYFVFSAISRLTIILDIASLFIKKGKDYFSSKKAAGSKFDKCMFFILSLLDESTSFIFMALKHIIVLAAEVIYISLNCIFVPVEQLICLPIDIISLAIDQTNKVFNTGEIDAQGLVDQEIEEEEFLEDRVITNSNRTNHTLTGMEEDDGLQIPRSRLVEPILNSEVIHEKIV